MTGLRLSDNTPCCRTSCSKVPACTAPAGRLVSKQLETVVSCARRGGATPGDKRLVGTWCNLDPVET